MANAGQRVQALVQSQDEVQESRPVQKLANLAAEINESATETAPSPSLAESFPAQLKEDPSQQNRTGLPDRLKTGVETLSGVSLDNVRVHYNSPQPAQLNALAYAQGTDIHVAPGQEQHLPHEAWHVVQQAQGRVRPTMQMKSGVPVNDDAGLEHEADVMGAKALNDGEPPIAPETGATSTISDDHAPVQRLIGFEVEYQVPTFGPARQPVKLVNGAKEPSTQIQHFLFGGLAYGTELGGSAKPGENSFRLTSDHKSAVSTEPIRAKLAEMKKLDPADTVDPDASSNLEYVTSPVDELGKGADKTLDTLIDKVAAHATTTFGVASKGAAGYPPGPAKGVATGTPEDKIKDWLSPKDFLDLKPVIEEFRDNIRDSCYLQATVGILPRAVHLLFKKAKQEEGSLHYTGKQFSQIYEAVETASAAAGAKVKEHKYIQDLVRDKKTEVTTAVAGMIRLLIMYLVGEALSHTNAFPGGSIKNAVPFLIKIDPSTIVKSGPDGMLFNSVPNDFVTALASSLSEQKEITVQYWRDLGYEAAAQKKYVTTGTIENLVKVFLQGKKPPDTNIRTGSQLKNLDKMPQIENPDDIFDEKLGIPLEYRFIKARPSAAGLKAELQKITAEARAINLSTVSEETKAKIEKQVKE